MKKKQEELELKSKEIYIDANVFVYSVLDEKDIGENARNIIEKIKNNIFRGFTSTLTIDEILWAVQKQLGKEKAADIANDFISMTNLEFLSVGIDIIKNSINEYKNSLDPRDAIHLASMQSKNIKIIVSSDSDFDKIKDIKRINFRKK